MSKNIEPQKNTKKGDWVQNLNIIYVLSVCSKSKKDMLERCLCGPTDSEVNAPHSARIAPHLARIAPHLARIAPHLARIALHLARIAPHLARIAPHLARIAPHLARIPPHSARIAPHGSGSRLLLINVPHHFDPRCGFTLADGQCNFYVEF